MGGFLDDFYGTSQRRDIQRGRDRALDDINAGTDAATERFDAGITRLDPYAQGGQEGYRDYIASLGILGPQEQARVQGRYFADPVQNQLMDRITRANTRAFTGSGMANSGAATQGLTNALLANWGAYQDRLRGVGEGGVQAAGAQSGIDVNAGNTQFAAGQQRAATNTSAANAIAASRSTGINNLIGVGSVIASAMTGMPIPSRAAGGSNALTRGGVGAAPY